MTCFWLNDVANIYFGWVHFTSRHKTLQGNEGLQYYAIQISELNS